MTHSVILSTSKYFQIKAFVKNCRNVEYAQMFKSLNMKLNEHAVFVKETMNARNLDLHDEALMVDIACKITVRHLEYLDGPSLTKSAEPSTYC